MPQPFPDSHVHNVNLTDPVADRPQLAARAADVIATWSKFDAILGSLFTTMLGVDPGPGSAIYETIRSDNGRRDAFRAIAKQTIKDTEDAAIMDFILDRSKTAGRARDVIAHNLWGTQPEFPDALLLVEPKAFAASQVRLAAPPEASEEEKLATINELITELRRATTVWKEQDFIDARVRIGKLLYLAVTFGIVISHLSSVEDRAEAKRQMLQASPELRQHLVKGT
jgi:hypothetical protein